MKTTLSHGLYLPLKVTAHKGQSWIDLLIYYNPPPLNTFEPPLNTFEPPLNTLEHH